ncbi:acyl carrier protein [Pseudomonas graminis]|uniref:acyl carrier protein n=1 Tax=Pseudomonas graminis TaxID=158627 RepID=UPI00234B41F6|nr:acyl carrier protein [Pseudomonas graminis]MDC6383388.1 acyl carrier protein [Pseudomonas graminis]
MDRADIASRTKKVIAAHLAVDEGNVSEKSSFIKDLEADSIDLVELRMAVEEVFEIEITDEEAESIKTVGQAIDLIFTKAH